MLTARDVAQEVERLAADAGFGYVHMVVSGGRIERIDRCVQIKAERAETVLRGAAAQGAIRRG